ncbi:MAG: hypothetical protein B0A82_26735 [Alkalinema sp. CACIAM 70d]|nr:MAG: hypothetical protein B0A82_26735 [Alkalinema sp. CACIAM 70d]
MTFPLAQQSLTGLSQAAAELWDLLTHSQTADEEAELLAAIWETQEAQEDAIDLHAELAFQLDAEIAGIKQRLEHLKTVHQEALDRLERWRQELDKSILKSILEQNIAGGLSDEVVGHSLRITIRENPPSCELLVDAKELPGEFRKKKVTYSADKKAIIAAWKQGIPVDGTHIECRQRVIYSLTATTIQDFKNSLLADK